MPLIVELTADEEERVQAAQQNGIDVTALIRGMVSGLPRITASPSGDTNGTQNDRTNKTAERDATLALLARWQEEDAAATPEEIEENERQWEALKQGINANRAEVGARRIF